MGLIKEGGLPSFLLRTRTNDASTSPFMPPPPPPIPCEECKSGEEGVGLVLRAGVSRMPVIQGEHTQASSSPKLSREEEVFVQTATTAVSMLSRRRFSGITAPMDTDMLKAYKTM